MPFEESTVWPICTSFVQRDGCFGLNFGFCAKPIITGIKGQQLEISRHQQMAKLETSIRKSPKTF
jgi:hypothetical protein